MQTYFSAYVEKQVMNIVIKQTNKYYMCVGDDVPLHSMAEPTPIVLLSDHCIKLFPKHLSLYL